MAASQPDPQSSSRIAGAPIDPAGTPESRGASNAPDLDAEGRPLQTTHLDDPKAKAGGETPGREPHDPHSSS